MLAVEAPWKLVAIAGTGLALAAFAASPHHRHARGTHRLTLHAPSNPHHYYLTRFVDGDISIARDDARPKQIVFRDTIHWIDHCDYLATETLEPDGANRYAYYYDETILSCDPGASPYGVTPRSGYVVVDE